MTARREPGIRRGAHRERQGILAAGVPVLAGLLGLAALLGVLSWVGRARPTDTAGARAAAATAGFTGSPAETSALHRTTTSAAPARPSSSPPAAVPDVPVTVLSAPGRRGVGRDVAARLRQHGWTVAVVGTFRGSFRRTTVFYPAGRRDAGRALAGQLSGDPQVRPVAGNLSRSRLALIVAADYTG